MLQQKLSRAVGNSQEIEAGYVVGADIGGTSLRLALADMDGKVVAKWKVSTVGIRDPHVVVDLIHDGGKYVPPSVHGVIGISRGGGPGSLRLITKQIQVSRAVVILEPGCQPIGPDLSEGSERLFDPVLQQQIVRDGELVVLIKLCMVRQHLEESVILFKKPGVLGSSFDRTYSSARVTFLP